MSALDHEQLLIDILQTTRLVGLGSVDAIADRSGYDHHQTRRALKDLEKAGKVVQTKARVGANWRVR